MVCLDEEGAGLVFESVTLMRTSLLLRLLTRPLSLVGDRTPGRRSGELAADELDAGELAVLICPSLLSADALLTLLLLLLRLRPFCLLDPRLESAPIWLHVLASMARGLHLESP